MKSTLRLRALSTAFLVTASALAAAPDSQRIKVDHLLQIPGESLPSGIYVFSLEDRLRDRAIVRIQNTSTGHHSFLLAVPSLKIGPGRSDDLILFRKQSGDPTLRGWICPNCAKPLEFVYGKQEAVKITAETGQSVVAADPAYDKLPANLSEDDMKIVTLWLLAPERVSQNRGVGLTAAKYQTSGEMPPVPTRNRLPQTSSDAYAWAVSGLVMLMVFGGMRALRLRRSRCVS